MAIRLLSFLLFTTVPLFFTGCGIKKPPSPLPEPRYSVKRIGDVTYVLPRKEGVSAQGFIKKGNYLMRIDGRSFCFRVRHKLGKKRKECVPPAGGEPPEVITEVSEDSVILHLDGYGAYRIYPLDDEGFVVPKPIMEVKDKRASIERKFSDYRVAITGVINGSESFPRIIEVIAREPPVPEPPTDPRIVSKKGRIYIYWWHGDEDVSFEVLMDGSLLTPTPIRENVFSLPDPGREVTFEIRAVNKYGRKSEPVKVNYKP